MGKTPWLFLFTRNVRRMLFFGRKKRLIDFASCAG